MRLSKNFSLEEMTRSMVAARKGIDNTPGAGEIKPYPLVALNHLTFPFIVMLFPLIITYFNYNTYHICRLYIHVQ